MKDLIAAAIKSTYDTRSPGGIERCTDLLIRLKSMSLSVKDILYFSKSIFKLETLRRHRNPRIREVSQSLLTSLLKTLYSQGSDKSPGLNKARLKRKEAKANLLVSDKKQDHKTLAREPVVRRAETKKTAACMSVTTKPVTTTALPQQSRRDIKDGKVTTKTLIPPPRRVVACKNVPAKASRNPKTEEMVELFEAAKKAADVANAKGILSGKSDALRCVEAISLLMKMNVTPKPNEPRKIIERLERLAKHKDRTICSAATTLLQIWRQRIREQERKESSAIKNPRRVQRTCGQGFTRESTKAMKTRFLKFHQLTQLSSPIQTRCHKIGLKGAMTSLMMATPFPCSLTQCKKTTNLSLQRTFKVSCMQTPLEELYNVKVERKVSERRLEELGVSRWSVWKTGKCKLPWDWQVDQLVYIEEGEVRVVPQGSERFMQFLAGDLVRYPKWLEADLFFNAPYRERYCFKAYGDD
ncbi:hypothetical protein F2Q69_00011465 [Brassica cretica]|uniref:TFIIS N-terminal domain-containing protein n=1 Tax=Brassica cretica TaxID=69181 RepID=A0A8S9R2G4_BRACR|nr:hypothetical protein F2Q69_00011465 [Brassica cretica]